MPPLTAGLERGYSRLYARPTGTNQPLVPVPSLTPWTGASNFAAAALLARGDYLYLFGTPAGRHGGIELARTRVAPGSLPTTLEYWDGTTWEGAEGAAATIVPSPVGEFNVQFNTTFGRFVLTYGDDLRNEFVIRDAPSLEGPYTEERPLDPVSPSGTGLYAPFTLPFAVSGDQSLLFTLSQCSPYDVAVYHADLQPRRRGRTSS